MKLLPSSSSFKHLRLPFSVFLLPVFVFALSQVPAFITYKAWLTFLVWHFFVYPASNGYNSYFDKDEGSIALLKNPPPVDKSLYYLSLLLDAMAICLAFLVSIEFVLAVLVYGTISKLYSYPGVRLKKYPLISFLIIFVFQGGFVYWTSYAAISGLSIWHGWNLNLILAGLICSCLIGANYPLTQIYQHDEDSKRGDKTISMQLGIKGSFIFTALLFSIALGLSFWYWRNLDNLNNFRLFLLFSLPVFLMFGKWLLKAWRDEKEASYKNMSQMSWTGGIMMLTYFIIIWIR